ncbi:MAG TPA: BMP family ABC transporter substrate-binding protein [Candidatus Deferrimicrobium sp.]|nr:BMP family ABC transporter substrate-binding protein [Candidatus Deferrimicrobium sp.]
MHKRSLGLTLFGSLAIIVAACGGGATPSPSTATPSTAASQPASVAPSGSPAPSQAALKIGVVTDVGQLEDKSFNQSSNEGAKAAAAAIGGTHDVIVTQNISDYAPNIQSFVDKKFDVIVTVGFLIGTDTAKAAKANPDIHFIGVDQGVCVDETGAPDATFACKGDAAKLLPNYQGIVFAEEQPGYLAGIIAASVTKSGTIAAVGGTNVPAVVAYNAGYVAGAKSVKADIKTLYQETDPDASKGFNDPAKGKAIAQQFIGQGADVIFQIAGLTGQGALEAACAKPGVWGIGVDVDQALSIPTVAKCLLTSAEKKLKDTVTTVVTSVADGTFKAGTVTYNAASTPAAIGLSPYHDNAAMITPAIQALVDKAFADMKAGTLTPPRK